MTMLHPPTYASNVPRPLPFAMNTVPICYAAANRFFYQYATTSRRMLPTNYDRPAIYDTTY